MLVGKVPSGGCEGVRVTLFHASLLAAGGVQAISGTPWHIEASP